MFEYVHLEYYKSFDNFTFDLTDRQGNPKKVVLIYGANASGKSNLASSFAFLGESLRTMNIRDLMEQLLASRPKTIDEEVFSSFVKSQFRDLEALIKNSKMISSNEPMVLEFGFQLNGKSGRYMMETNSTEIIHERLEYILTKNRGVYFDITPNKATINRKLFTDADAFKEIEFACKRFWGKHTLLSIILHEIYDKADSYIKGNLNSNLAVVLDFLTQVSCKVNFPGRMQDGGIVLPDEMLRDYENGDISIGEEYILDNNEKLLDMFFKSITPNIHKVFYKRTKNDASIDYSLYVSKNIAGKIRDIPFDLESKGTRSLLHLLSFMLLAVNGSFVMIDEFDTGVHDLLTKNIFKSLQSSTTGQLILTTHATMLMKQPPLTHIYILREDSNGRKTIRPVSYYEKKSTSTTNAQKRYIEGEYGGIPENSISLDFKEMLDIIGLYKQ